MVSPWDILLDGLTSLRANLGAAGALFTAVTGMGLLATRLTGNAGGNPGARLLASLGMGSAALCLPCYALILAGRFWPALLRPGSIAILVLAGLPIPLEILLWYRPRAAAKPAWLLPGSLTAAGLGLLLVMRLAFLTKLIYPPYSDSPIHYQIIQGLLDPEVSGEARLSLGSLFSNYYHFGFHALAAWLSALSGLAPERVIPLLGQFFLVCAPVSAGVLAYHLTQNRNAGLFAGLLAATSWMMPVFAVNWGKYPAVGALACLPAVLAATGAGWKDRKTNPMRLAWALILLLGLTLLHTRALIAALLAGTCLWLAKRVELKEEAGFPFALRLSSLYALSLWPLLSLLEDYYIRLPILIAWILLLPFAFQAFPRPGLAVFFFTFAAWLATLLPRVVLGSGQGLLDRQFLEILLYIPLSILGGAGAAGLLKQRLGGRIGRGLAVGALGACLLLAFLQNRTFYPDACCNYFQKDDRAAFEWIKGRTAPDRLFLIASFKESGQVAGTDAGIWLEPLLGANVNKIPFDTDWNSAAAVEELCRTGARQTLLYAGGRLNSFNPAALEASEWTREVFRSGNAAVYELEGCGGP